MTDTGSVRDAPSMRSSAHRLHETMGATFRPLVGWEIPAAYGDVNAERARLGETVGICDISARGKIDLRGALDGIGGAPRPRLEARVSDVWALWLTEPGDAAPTVEEIETHGAAGAMVTDATHLYAGFAVAGPLALRLFERLTPFDVATVPPGGAVGARVADLRGVLVRRSPPDLAGGPETVFEWYVGSESGRFCWEALLDEASALGGGAVGWDVLQEWGWQPC